jgi:peptidoglycan/LPS O-acetylase OafA/YrhL
MKRFTLGDALRGIAALGVVAWHTQLPIPFPLVNTLWPDFFFVLSGFVLAKYYRSDLTAPGFAKYAAKRAVRFYPLVIVVVASSVAITAVSGILLHSNNWQATINPLQILGAASLVQVLYPPAMKVLGPLWSLSAEVFINLGLYWVIRKYSTAALISLSLIGLGFILWQAPLQNSIRDPYALFTGWGSLGRATLGFCLGLLVQRFPANQIRYSRLAVAVALLLGLTWLANTSDYAFAVAAPVFAFALREVFLFEPMFAKSKLTGIAEFLGTSSFGIYVWHGALQPIAYQIAAKLVPNPLLMRITDFALLVIISIIATRITFRWIEKPTMNWINARTRIPAPTGTASVSQ